MANLYSDKMLSLVLMFMVLGKSDQFCADNTVVKPTCEERDPGFLRCYDWIPKTVDIKTTHVEILCLGRFRTPGIDIIIANETFVGKGWNHVQSLKLHLPSYGTARVVTIDSGGFIGLDSLIQLRMHLSKANFGIGLLRPLKQLLLLDLSNCLNLKPSNFYKKILSDSDVVPNLETLILHNMGTIKGERYDLNERFWRCVSLRPITYLDISGMKVNVIDLKAFLDNCDNIRYLNLSDTSIIKANRQATQNKRCQNLEVFNATGTNWGSEYNVICGLPLTAVYQNEYISINIDKVAPISAAHTIIFNMFCKSKGIVLFLYNVSVSFVTNFTWSTKHFYLSNINTPVLDISLDCAPIQIETLWFTEMNIEFFRPLFNSCASFMLDFNLSGNRLEVMRKRNSSVFDVLFKNFHKIQKLYLKRNGFTDLPLNMFSNHNDLQVLDLSDNLFTQIHFRLMHLKKLTHVNLSNNKVMVLDATSIATLKAFSGDSNHGYRTLVLAQNPLQCSKCRDRNSVEWILESDLLLGQQLVCFDGKRSPLINENVLNDVIDDCYKVMRITLETTIPLTAVAIAVISSYCMYKRQKLKCTIQNVRNRLKESGFVVYFSFSRHDDDFVSDNVFNQMNQGLRRLTNIDRTLICTGDNNFIYGIRLHDAITECLEECSSFVALVTDSFLQSEFCKDEYDRAVELKVPIILMVKGEVNIALMRPHMLEHFMRYPRILWTERGDGRFALRSSWEHVCHSILKSIDFQHEEAPSLSFCGRLRYWWRACTEDQDATLEQDDAPLLQDA